MPEEAAFAHSPSEITVIAAVCLSEIMRWCFQKVHRRSVLSDVLLFVIILARITRVLLNTFLFTPPFLIRSFIYRSAGGEVRGINSFISQMLKRDKIFCLRGDERKKKTQTVDSRRSCRQRLWRKTQQSVSINNNALVLCSGFYWLLHWICLSEQLFSQLCCQFHPASHQALCHYCIYTQMFWMCLCSSETS